MARGRATNYDEQRALILARSAQLFAQQGYSATSMHQVAAACGLGKATLYHYYRDKTALLLHISDHHVTRLQALVAEVLALDLAPQARLHALITRFVQAYADAQSAHRVLTEDVRFLPAEQQALVLDKQREVVKAFAQAVAALRPEADAAHWAKPLTMLLFGMINWMFTWMRPGGTLDHGDMAPVVAELFVGGLALVTLPAVQHSARSAKPMRIKGSEPTTMRS